MSKTKALALAPDPALTALKVRTTKLLKSWQSVEVLDTPTFEAASSGLLQAVQIRKDLKALPVYVELQKAKLDLKAKEKVLKDVDRLIESTEDSIRACLSRYAMRQRDAQEKLITKALDSGKDEKAALIAAKPFVPPVQGLSFTEHWHAEVTDKLLFLKAIVNGEISPDAVEPNLVWLNARARALASENISVPGVKGVKETSSTVRG